MSTPATDASAGPALPLIDLLLPNLNDTLGAALIGTFISLILFGLVLHQAYQYYATYPGDKIWLKAYVATILLLETVGTFFCAHVCYFYMVSNYANPIVLNDVPWSVSMFGVVGSLTVAVSQVFFMQRVWNIGRQYRPVVTVSAVFVLLELSVCFVSAVDGFQRKHWTKLFSRIWLISIHNAASAVAELITTSILIYALHKSRTGVTRTNSMINLLIAYAVSTGLLTLVYNVIALAFTIANPDNLIWLGVIIIGIKVYSNCLLAALNSRRSVSERHSVQVGNADTSPFGVSIMKESATAVSYGRGQGSQPHGITRSSGKASSTLKTDAIEFKVTKGSVTAESSTTGPFDVDVC